MLRITIDELALPVHERLAFRGRLADQQFDPDEHLWMRGPGGFIARHTLRLTSTSNTGEAQTLQVAIDLEDIESMKVSLDRALAKHRQLVELLEEKELPCLN